MTSKKTEGIGVTTIYLEILRNGYLASEIPVNDKTPSWDGEIWVYDSLEQKKSDLFGKVPVQVKGKKVINFSSELKYKLERADLDNYYKNGGILFLVVEFIDVDTTQIFYLSLMPIDLKNIITDMKQQQSKKLTFKKFTSKDRELEFICRNFINNNGYQSFRLISNATNDKKFDSFKSDIIVPDKQSLYEAMFELDFYMYGHIKEHDVNIPLFKMDIQQLIERAEIEVSTNGQVFYREVKRIIEKERLILKFGESFKIIFQKNSEFLYYQKIDFKFKYKGNLENRIKDAKFLIELLKTQVIEINGNQIQLENFENANETSREMNNYIKFYEEVSQTLVQLGVPNTVNFDELTQNDIVKLEILKETILFKNYDKLNLSNENVFIEFLIGDLKIVLVTLEVDGKWEVFDLFDLKSMNEKFIVKAVSENEEESGRHSPYANFGAAELFNISNLKIDIIEMSLKNADYTKDFCFGVTNNYLLKLLNYYDNTGRKEVLHLVLNIYDYLLSLDRDSDTTHIFINKMQTIKRLRSFRSDELEQIIKYKNKDKSDNQMLCAFHLLLDNKAEFEYTFKKLTREEQHLFKEFPIYYLK
ncbi:hypothetical protein BTS2_3335 [Bacillus sp. TS-2]|nr:hypothetical protein BTS2_3335 [Bacillus sp. TS-2]